MAVRNLIAYFRGVDELTPVMNRINGGLTNTARISQETSTRLGGTAGMLSREWDRFQRSFSHAFSYAAVYQIYQAYNNLKNFNAELGQLNAMAPGLGGQINQIGDIAINISTRTGAPLNDVQESINNIVQSIPNMSDSMRRNLIPVLADIEARASRIMDVDPRSFGSTVLGIARAYYSQQQLAQDPQILERVASRLYETRITTPRLTGQDITQYIPTLIGGARTAGFTLDQALAMFSVAQQTIQRPATTTQYLRQLMLRIRKPTSTAQKYFNQAGLTPDVLANLSGMDILQRLIEHGLSLPGGTSVQNVQQAIRHGNLRRINVSGQAQQFFQNTIGGRIQSEVAMTALTTNLGGIALQEQRLRNNLDAVNQAYDRWRSYNSLQIMQNALSNATTDILRNFMPALSIGASGLTGFATILEQGSRHMRSIDQRLGNYVQNNILGLHTRHNVVSGVLDTGFTIGGIAAAMSSGKLLRRLSGLFRRGGRGLAAESTEGGILESRVGRAALRPFTAAYAAEGAAAALANQANGTPSMPFWVVIHPLSMTTAPGLFGSKAGTGVENTAKNVERSIWNKIKTPFTAAAGGATATARGALRNAFGALARGGARAGRFVPDVPGGLAGGVLGGAALGALMALVFPESAGPNMRGDVSLGDFNLSRMFPRTHFNNLRVIRQLAYGRNLQSRFGQTRGVQNIISQLTQRQITPRVAEHQLEMLLRSWSTRNRGTLPFPSISTNQLGQLNRFISTGHLTKQQAQQIGFGQLEAVFTLEPTQDLKNLIKPQVIRAKVPVNLWDKSSSPPTERGKAKVTRNRG